MLEQREYARLGVASCWLLDVDTPSRRVLELDGADDREVAYVEGEQAVTLQRPFPVTVVPADLMRP